MIYGEIKQDRILKIGIIPKKKMFLNCVVVCRLPNATRMNFAISHSHVH